MQLKNNFNYDQPFVVIGALLEKDGKYLFVKEAEGPAKGKWNLPAGKWDKGESLVEGAQREVLEETGVQFIAEKLLGIYFNNKEGSSELIFIFLGSISDNVVMAKKDTEEMKWLTLNEIISLRDSGGLRHNHHTSIIDDYKSGVSHPLDFVRTF